MLKVTQLIILWFSAIHSTHFWHAQLAHPTQSLVIGN